MFGKKSKVLLATVLLLNDPVESFACGSCVDYICDWFFPFARPLFLIFFIWYLIKLIFGVVGLFLKTPISLSESKHPWITFIVLVGIFIGISFVNLGSVLVPFLVVTLPAWLWCVFKSIRNTIRLQEKKTLHMVNLYFHWGVSVIIPAMVIFSYMRFNATDRLLTKLDHPYNSSEAIKRLIAKGEEASSKIVSMLTKYDVQSLSYGQMTIYINLMKIIQGINDPSAAPLLAEKFQKIHYRDSIYIGDLFAETAVTLASLDGKMSADLILQKYKEVRLQSKMIGSYRLDKMEKGFDEALNLISDEVVISAYKKLGAPDLGQDRRAYQKWFDEAFPENM